MSAGIVDGASPPSLTDSTAATLPPPRRRRRWPLWTALSLGLLVVAALITGSALGAAYQPVGQGPTGGNLIGHLVTRKVNNFSPMTGQTYLPPQKPGSGGLYVSLVNNGPLPVTIESASLNPPYAQGPQDRQSQVLRDAGPAAYWPMYGSQNGQGTPLAGLVLQPGQAVLVRLPVTTAGCWMPAHYYSILNSFSVTTRFLSWTHQVQIFWTDPYNEDEGAILAHAAAPASEGGVCPR